MTRPVLQAVVERCGHRLPPVHTLITLGGQHQGVKAPPGCSSNISLPVATACSAMQLMLERGAYALWVRSNLVQAQYYKDPAHMSEYLEYNKFLADINNELPADKPQYADNLASLSKFVMVQFTQDSVGEWSVGDGCNSRGTVWERGSIVMI